MERHLFSEEHEIFRSNFRRFVETRVLPKQAKWRAQGVVDREIWLEAGEAGFLCPWMEEEYGGAGGDFLHSVIVMEELSRAYESGWAASLHSDIIVPYIHAFATPEQKSKWLPGCAAGQTVTALAMTEPGTGSDLAAIATTAKRDGGEYVINGAKTFISNGMSCDLVVVAARTANSDDPHRSVSLFVVERDAPGFIRSRKLEKMGMESQDTAELAFDDCRIPAGNLLGQEGMGFMMLMQQLQQERLCVAIISQASAEKVLEDAIAYTQERQAFGRSISKFQNTQFTLAQCATEIEVGRAFLDSLVGRHVAGEYLVKECSMAKLWQTEMQGRIVDACLQLYGGYGYMLEYPISRAYVDARVQRIYAGTSEIMKVIIAKQMGL
ncbi:MAG: acyl-CoA dehydrogenase family protein [Myxococcales bacterium]|nr:acyl-CoA dehydrogenase family protein [Myxococcales bacterium]